MMLRVAMKMIKILLKFLSVFLIAFTSEASYVGITGGYYSLSATTTSGSTSLSNLGAYRLSISHEIHRKVSLNVGYNILFESIITGDSSFGFDLGANYFHWGSGNVGNSKIGNIDIKIFQDWSPYVGFNFNQRQYQSIRSSYSGIGLTVGSLKNLLGKMNLIIEARYVSLSGATSSTATELSLQSGISYSY